MALLVEMSNRYGRDLLHGVHDWLQRCGGRWVIRLAEQSGAGAPPPWLRHWDGDGLIARVDTRAIAAALRGARMPVVDVSAERLRSEFSRVSIDNEAVARLAYAHLSRDRRRHFAYCGDDRHLWARLRGRAFVRVLRETGQACAVFSPGSRLDRTWEQTVDAIARWLEKLPKPAGVFASNDRRAQQVIAAGQKSGLAMPDEVAVLGVDDDELVCELCDPPLSSILPDARRIGYEAAGLLSRMMSGWKSRRPVERCIGPVRVVERQSTDALSVADRHVAMALRYIRDHALDGICVKEVLAAVPMSRTLLEEKFRQHVGESPHRLIKRRQMEKVRQLLMDTDLPVARIADMSGFESASYLSTVFRKATGQSPRAFRSGQRGGA